MIRMRVFAAVVVGVIAAALSPSSPALAATSAAPATPTNVVVSEIFGDLTASWNAVTGATGYEVLIRNETTNQPRFQVASWTQDAGTSSPMADINFSQLSDGMKYAIEVVAQNGKLNSAPSAPKDAVFVVGPQVNDISGDGSAFIGWVNSPGATSYTFQQFDNNCDGDDSTPTPITAKPSQVHTTPYPSTYYNITGLTDGTCYTFVISAYNSYDGKASVASSGDLYVTPLGTPSWNSATKAGNASVHLAWSTVTGAIQYDIWDRDATQNTQFTDAQTVQPVTGAVQSGNITGLTNGDSYQFFVVAENNTGSNSTTVQTLTPSASS